MEQWKGIPGFEDRYMISDLGRVKSLARMIKLGYDNKGHLPKAEGLLNPGTLKSGVARVTLYDTKKRPTYLAIARTVYRAFVGPIPQGMIVKTVDRDPYNCAVGNLELLTRAQLLARNSHG